MLQKWKKTVSTLIAVLFLIPCLFSEDLYAQNTEPVSPTFDFGIRSGWDTNNDQFLFGVQTEIDNALGIFTVAPSFDYGTGNDMTTYSFNSDLRVDLVSLPGSETNIYFGAGPTLFVWQPDNASNDTEIGLSVVTGFKFLLGKSSRYNIEARFGTGDIPETRLLFGLLF